MPVILPEPAAFRRLAAHAPPGALLTMVRRLLADQLTPVLAYRRLVDPDQRLAPSFLLESVVGGERIGRYSFLGAQPTAEIIARGYETQLIDHRRPDRSRTFRSDDPLKEMHRLTGSWKLAPVPPDIASSGGFLGGWFGFAGYDTVRYLEGETLAAPPPDDRRLPDLHMGLYPTIVVFDHVQKTVSVITQVLLDDFSSGGSGGSGGPSDPSGAAYAAGAATLDSVVQRISTQRPSTRPGAPELPIGEAELLAAPPKLPFGNMAAGRYQDAVRKCKEYIAAGDAFQVVVSQRFERTTSADPFDIYRALRVVNPSPYMFYVQIQGGMLIGSSPEILCRVHDGVVTNRPLAGTRRRSADPAEDLALEKELLADPKERAEHIMLVDLGRNDVGRVAVPASIQLPQIMAVERYSHVMHISSTVTGRLRPGLTCWDALRHTLPVGTVSGAPKIRAMQIIDELEPTRRGPYAGAVGHADFAGNMDMAIALRTMVVLPSPPRPPGHSATGPLPPAPSPVPLGHSATGPLPPAPSPVPLGHSATGPLPPAPSPVPLGHSATGPLPPQWTIHIQSGAGIVADSDPDTEHQETVSKAAALAKAIDVAETAFPSRP